MAGFLRLARRARPTKSGVGRGVGGEAEALAEEKLGGEAGEGCGEEGVARGADSLCICGRIRGRDLREERFEPVEVGHERQGFAVVRERGLEGADFGAGGDAAQGGGEGDDAEELREAVVVLAGEKQEARGIGGGEGVEEGSSP